MVNLIFFPPDIEFASCENMLQPELVRPLGHQRQPGQRKWIAGGMFVVLSALAVIALSAVDGGSRRQELLYADQTSPTGVAAAIRGSVSTADQEATAIMATNGMHFDEDMGVPYTRGDTETGGSFDQTAVNTKRPCVRFRASNE